MSIIDTNIKLIIDDYSIVEKYVKDKYSNYYNLLKNTKIEDLINNKINNNLFYPNLIIVISIMNKSWYHSGYCSDILACYYDEYDTDDLFGNKDNEYEYTNFEEKVIRAPLLRLLKKDKLNIEDVLKIYFISYIDEISNQCLVGGYCKDGGNSDMCGERQTIYNYKIVNIKKDPIILDD